MKVAVATTWHTWGQRRHIGSTLFLLVVAVLMAGGMLVLGASPAAAQTEGDIVVSCPEGTTLEGTGQNLTCLDITTTKIDALEASDGTLSCRDGSTGSPTEQDPTCESEVRNSVRPIITCNGELVENPGDGDACLIDTDQDGVIDGEDLEPNNGDVGTEADLAPTPAPIVTPTVPAAEPTEEPVAAADTDQVETPDTADETDASEAGAGASADDGSGTSPLLFVAIGILALAAIGYGVFRGRSRAADDSDLD